MGDRETLLEVRNLQCNKSKGEPIFSNASFSVYAGDVIVVQGRSGSGKSTLLKCISHLNLYSGEVFYRGRTPKSYGIPAYRTRVMYVPQRASLLPGTPHDFVNAISAFGSLNKSSKGQVNPADVYHDIVDLAETWGIDEELWDRNWSSLSGGEMQRMALSIAVGIKGAEIMLLDEPTSALDPDTSARVERYLTSEVKRVDSNLKALIWVTHSEEQGHRVGTRFLQISPDGIREENVDSHV